MPNDKSPQTNGSDDCENIIPQVIQFLNAFFSAVSKNENVEAFFEEFGFADEKSSTIAEFCQRTKIEIPPLFSGLLSKKYLILSEKDCACYSYSDAIQNNNKVIRKTLKVLQKPCCTAMGAVMHLKSFVDNLPELKETGLVKQAQQLHDRIQNTSQSIWAKKRKEEEKETAQREKARLEELKFMQMDVKKLMQEVINPSSYTIGSKLRRLLFEKSRKKLILQKIYEELINQEVTSIEDFENLENAFKAFIKTSLMRQSSWWPWATHTTSAELCLNLLNGHYLPYRPLSIHFIDGNSIMEKADDHPYKPLSYKRLATWADPNVAVAQVNNHDKQKKSLFFSIRYNKKAFYKAVLETNPESPKESYVKKVLGFSTSR